MIHNSREPTVPPDAPSLLRNEELLRIHNYRIKFSIIHREPRNIIVGFHRKFCYYKRSGDFHARRAGGVAGEPGFPANKIDSILFFYIEVNSREIIEKMTTPVLYSKITKGEDLDKVTTPEQLEAKKNFALLTNYTKIVKANIQQDTSSIILNSTHGVITGQPISGNGIDEYTFITEVDYTTNTVTINRPILNGGSNISISINNYQEHTDEEMDDGPYEFNYQYPTHFDWLQEDFNQNY